MITEQPITFAALLRRSRRALGMTQEELAERAHLSTEAISALERGINRRPHRDTVELLSDALALTAETRIAFETAARGFQVLPSMSQENATETPGTLPAFLTSLIGREHDEAAVSHLLSRPDLRLLSLIGPAGIGKTRLAVQAGSSSRVRFRDGVYFVALSTVRDPDMVLPAIAQTLGVRDAGRQSLATQVEAHLRGKQLLLVLDNFEQVNAAAPRVVELLAPHPEVKALVTSRASLRVRGEQEYVVPPLALPDPHQLPASEEDLAHYAAIALFLHRARAVKPSFEVTTAFAPVVAGICQRLDGMPLAIELAAPRIKLMSPTALLARLDHQLSVLTGGPQDLPTRQQTIENTVAWSYDLLDADEKMLFKRLGVFTGGWTLDAAEAVCSAGATSRMSVLDGIARLFDKSLARQLGETDGEPRFSMLETIREYAVKQLDESAEADSQRRVHAEYFMALAEAAGPQLTGSDQDAWLDRLADEYENLRAAMRWALASGEALIGLRLAGPLQRFWYVRGYLGEGRIWLERVLKMAENNPSAELTAPRARALYTAGVLAAEQGDYDDAERLAADSGALYRTLGDARWTAAALTLGGNVAKFRADYERAALLFEAALEEFRRLGDDKFAAVALNNLGAVMTERADYVRARALFEESLALKRKLGERHGIGVALQNLGDVAHRQGDDVRAAAFYDECLAIRREQGDSGSIAQLLSNMGEVAIAQADIGRARELLDECVLLCRETGLQWVLANVRKNLGDLDYLEKDFAQAKSAYREGVALFQDAGNTQGTADCLDGLALVCAAEGRPARATQLCGSAAALREAAGTPLSTSRQAEYERGLETLRAVLPEDMFAAAWLAGRTTPPQTLLSDLEREWTPSSRT